MIFMRAIFTPTVFRNNTPNTPITNHPLRHILLLALLAGSAIGAKAQNYYIFYNSNYGYITNNNGNPGVSDTFSKSAIWAASGTLGTSNTAINSYTDDTKYMRGANGSFTLGNYQNNMQLRNNVLAYRTTNRTYHVYWTGSALSCAQNQSGSGFTPDAITISTNNTTSNPTLSITAASGLTGGGIQLTGNISGTYTPSYSSATVRNYNNTTTQTYYWTASTEATTTNPSITNWDGATKTWEVTTGGTYASVSSDGLVTITGNPTGNIVVRMTVSKGGYTGNTSITITRNAVAESTDYTYSPISITPAQATLDLDGTQVFAVSNTVTETATPIPAHTTVSIDGNTY